MDEKNGGNYPVNILINNLGEQVKYITLDTRGHLDFAIGKDKIYLVDEMYLERFINEHRGN